MTIETDSSQETIEPTVSEEAQHEAALTSALTVNEDVEGQANTEATPGETAAGTETNESTNELEFDWSKDNRYKEMWKEDPNNLYKSYKNSESKLTELSQQNKEVMEQFEGTKTKLGELQGLSDYMQLLNDNPEYAQKFKGIVEEFNKSLRRQQYGEDLPDNVIQKLEEVETIKQDLQAQKYEQEKKEQLTVIDSEIDRIKAFCSKNSLELNESDFLKSCLDKNIPSNLMYSVYVEQNMDTLLSNKQTKTQENVLKNVNAGNKAALSGVGKDTPKSTKVDMTNEGHGAQLLNVLKKSMAIGG